ncbi:hypothetical protein SBA2_40050 [Acidobacteriia bacterium SbA2]|nr:hypothetical protein SBA2_40050 [Acidobacteriia bacterium SbA2]
MMELVLEHAAVKIAADADVKGARKASHDIGAIVFAVAGHGISSEDLVVRGCDGCHKIARVFPEWERGEVRDASTAR